MSVRTMIEEMYAVIMELSTLRRECIGLASQAQLLAEKVAVIKGKEQDLERRFLELKTRAVMEAMKLN